MKIGIATDHHGVDIKKFLIKELEEKEYKVIDYGPNNSEMVDYPLYAFKVGEAIAKKEIEYGILLCSSGIGMSIACNKVRNVRCAKVNSKEEAMYARMHNNANVVALSASLPNIKEVVDIFLTTTFSNEERHHRRVDQIDQYQNNDN